MGGFGSDEREVATHEPQTIISLRILVYLVIYDSV